MPYPVNNLVKEIGTLSFVGNIIPDSWYLHIRNEKGKPQTNAILILAEVLYWFRPIQKSDENGNIVNYKKFKGNFLQKSYSELAEKFGLTSRQIRDAFKFLESKSLVKRRFEDIKVHGRAINNVLYIEVFPDEVSKITYKIVKENNSKCKNDNSINKNKHIKDNPSVISDSILQIIPKGTSIELKTIQQWLKSYSKEEIEQAFMVYNQQADKAKSEGRSGPRNASAYVCYILKNGIKPNMAPPPNKIVNTNTQTSSSFCSFIKRVKDWTLTFSREEKKLYETLIAIKPLRGKPICPSTASFWIKNYGLDNVNDALEVYLNQISKVNETYLGPENIEKYMRYALKNEIKPKKFIKTTQSNTLKKKYIRSKLSEEEKEFIAKIVNYIPPKGLAIESKIAIHWIKKFSLEKVKDAFLFYTDHVKKCMVNNKILPKCAGAYIRNALNKDLKPMKATGLANKSYAEEFKKLNDWNELVITDKYCRVEGYDWDWYFNNLQEESFKDHLNRAYKVYLERVGYSQDFKKHELANKSYAEKFKKSKGWRELLITANYCRVEDYEWKWNFDSLTEEGFKDCLNTAFEAYLAIEGDSEDLNQCKIA
ncbi:hypothetical protein BN1013_02464 [Candidatus Rubidus massiliensis]|nr:hypothetical protein BN1013_02464 [Candidatus Rubidus massiliensis]